MLTELDQTLNGGVIEGIIGTSYSPEKWGVLVGDDALVSQDHGRHRRAEAGGVQSARR